MTTMRRDSACVVGAIAMLVLAILPGGCATGSSPRPKAGAVALYEMGRHDEAYRAALREERGATGKARERAALTAGLSAHALGREAEASRWLRPLSRSSDRRIAGRADATLGLIALSDTRYDRAATLLASAGRTLDGEAAARAHYHAAEAFALSGRPDTARLHMRLALAQSIDEGLRSSIRARLGAFAYTVQLGAFSTRANAQRSVDEITGIARRLGLGEARIVDHVSATGRTLYLVQVGRFASQTSASDARIRMGRRGVITSIDR